MRGFERRISQKEKERMLGDVDSKREYANRLVYDYNSPKGSYKRARSSTSTGLQHAGMPKGPPTFQRPLIPSASARTRRVIWGNQHACRPINHMQC